MSPRSAMSLGEALQEADKARTLGWSVQAEESQLGFWLRAEAADGGKPLYARSGVQMVRLIRSGYVARGST